MKKNAYFITFEGIDGSGKTTHLELLNKFLGERGILSKCTREPGGTELGEAIRDQLLHSQMHIETEALLMFAARREHIAKVIIPTLSSATWVLSDRFTDASFAYQGGGRGLARDKLLQLEKFVHPNFQPDLTFLLDLPTEIARFRMAMAGRKLDRFESEDASFFERVRNGYLQRYKQSNGRIVLINANRDNQLIQVDIMNKILPLIT